MGQFELLNRVKLNNKYPNLDIYYGPYAATTSPAKTAVQVACLTVIPEIREKGLTVGIVEGLKIVEYWWESGVTDADLVKKTGGVSTNNFSSDFTIDPNTGIITINTAAGVAVKTDGSLGGNGTTATPLSLNNHLTNYIVPASYITLSLNRKNVVQGYLNTSIIYLSNDAISTIEDHWTVWFMSSIAGSITFPTYPLGGVSSSGLTLTAVRTGGALAPLDYMKYLSIGQTIDVNGLSRTITALTSSTITVDTSLGSIIGTLNANCRWNKPAPIIEAYKFNQLIFTKTQIELGSTFYILTGTYGVSY